MMPDQQTRVSTERSIDAPPGARTSRPARPRSVPISRITAAAAQALMKGILALARVWRPTRKAGVMLDYLAAAKSNLGDEAGSRHASASVTRSTLAGAWRCWKRRPPPTIPRVVEKQIVVRNPMLRRERLARRRAPGRRTIGRSRERARPCAIRAGVARRCYLDRARAPMLDQKPDSLGASSV